MVSQKPKYCKRFERNSHWRKLSMIMVWERRFSKTRILFIFFVYIFIHISVNMSPFGLKFSQMILHTETSKLMYNWSFLFVVLHKLTLLPSTFNLSSYLCIISHLCACVLQKYIAKNYSLRGLWRCANCIWGPIGAFIKLILTLLHSFQKWFCYQFAKDEQFSSSRLSFIMSGLFMEHCFVYSSP